jgi:hypothetical protein
VRTFCCIAAALILSSGTWASAQTQPGQTVQRTTKGQPDKDIRIGIYVNVQPDCSSGQLPSIRLMTPPTHGKVVVKKAKVGATNYKQCLALEVPGYVAVYHSVPTFRGRDAVTLEIKYPGGRIEVQEITVELGDFPSGDSV